MCVSSRPSRAPALGRIHPHPRSRPPPPRQRREQRDFANRVEELSDTRASTSSTCSVDRVRELRETRRREERAPATRRWRRNADRACRRTAGAKNVRDARESARKSALGLRALALVSTTCDWPSRANATSSCSPRRAARPTSHHIPASNTTNACAIVPCAKADAPTSAFASADVGSRRRSASRRRSDDGEDACSSRPTSTFRRRSAWLPSGVREMRVKRLGSASRPRRRRGARRRRARRRAPPNPPGRPYASPTLA